MVWREIVARDEPEILPCQSLAIVAVEVVKDLADGLVDRLNRLLVLAVVAPDVLRDRNALGLAEATSALCTFLMMTSAES